MGSKSKLRSLLVALAMLVASFAALEIVTPARPAHAIIGMPLTPM
jgi:hypothetical protein